MLASLLGFAAAFSPTPFVAAPHALRRGLAVHGTTAATHLAPRAPATVTAVADELLDVEVARNEQGALGIELDEANTIATNTGQAYLMLGDVVVAVDGEALDGRPIGQVIMKKDAYVFTVRRDVRAAATSLERVLLQIAKDAPVSGKALTTFDDIGELGGKARGLVDALEAAAPPSDTAELEEGMLGFWRLRLTDDDLIAKEGVTGFGGAPFCVLHASFLLLGANSPTAQLVEVIGQQNMGVHAIAALKGEWGVEAGTAAPATTEAYSRTEFAGSPQVEADPVAVGRVCTYLGQGLRIARAVGDDGELGRVFVYERNSPDVAQSEIARLLDLSVPRPPPTGLDDLGDVPLWARRSGGGGGGGMAPEPMPDRM